MPYKYLDDVVSDIAIYAWAKELEELFVSAADALTGVMLHDLTLIPKENTYTIKTESDSLEMLLFEVLQELIFLKDAKGKLVRFNSCIIEQKNGGFIFTGNTYFADIESLRVYLELDVKAVTMYNFSLTKEKGQWQATVVVDV